jgi:hypothetical protein
MTEASRYRRKRAPDIPMQSSTLIDRPRPDTAALASGIEQAVSDARAGVNERLRSLLPRTRIGQEALRLAIHDAAIPPTLRDVCCARPRLP